MDRRYSGQPAKQKRRAGQEEAVVRECWTQFQRYMLDDLGYAVTTRRNYTLRCQKAHRWLRSSGRPGIVQANEADLRAFWDSVTPSPSNRQCYRSALMSFFRFTNSMGWRPDNPAAPLPYVKQNRGIPRPLASGQTKKVLDVAAAMGPMMEAMVTLMAYTGIRNSELRGLRWSDLQDGYLRVLGKGSKERSVPVPLPAMESLVRWRGASTAALWMFPSGRSDDKPLPGQTFNYMFQELRDICCIPELTPHVLRHTFLSELYEVSGSDILMTQQAAGHASPTTTAIYAKVRPGKLQEATSKVTY